MVFNSRLCDHGISFDVVCKYVYNELNLCIWRDERKQKTSADFCCGQKYDFVHSTRMVHLIFITIPVRIVHSTIPHDDMGEQN